MGIREEIEEVFKTFDFTKIKGQPTDESLNLLVRELTNAAAGIPTTLGGGNHGHLGMIVDEAEYITFSNSGAKFVPPMNPGAYLTTVDKNNAAFREKQVVEHTELKEVFLTHEAIAHAMQTTVSTKNGLLNYKAKRWDSTIARQRKCLSIFTTMAETMTISA
eukprot:CCRYP_005640-RA/>CCRYP_005640-RA protein AED:0.45 eAED:0.45 QI:0/-1/0/1/-1/1/1/0/161